MGRQRSCVTFTKAAANGASRGRRRCDHRIFVDIFRPVSFESSRCCFMDYQKIMTRSEMETVCLSNITKTMSI